MTLVKALIKVDCLNQLKGGWFRLHIIKKFFAMRVGKAPEQVAQRGDESPANIQGALSDLVEDVPANCISKGPFKPELFYDSTFLSVQHLLIDHWVCFRAWMFTAHLCSHSVW